ncbi:MAG: hypothetical protein LC792_19365 [Actinobacteria bacterium]|nr:hypothetical protein [Actinomycetota bacterium]
MARTEQAIGTLRHRLEAEDTASRTRNPLLERSPATTLVEILLYDGRAEEAWTAAITHGCDDRTWITLTRAREATHPLDAVPIYGRAAAHIERRRTAATGPRSTCWPAFGR